MQAPTILRFSPVDTTTTVATTTTTTSDSPFELASRTLGPNEQEQRRRQLQLEKQMQDGARQQEQQQQQQLLQRNQQHQLQQPRNRHAHLMSLTPDTSFNLSPANPLAPGGIRLPNPDAVRKQSGLVDTIFFGTAPAAAAAVSGDYYIQGSRSGSINYASTGAAAAPDPDELRRRRSRLASSVTFAERPQFFTSGLDAPRERRGTLIDVTSRNLSVTSQSPHAPLFTEQDVSEFGVFGRQPSAASAPAAAAPTKPTTTAAQEAARIKRLLSITEMDAFSEATPEIKLKPPLGGRRESTRLIDVITDQEAEQDQQEQQKQAHQEQKNDAAKPPLCHDQHQQRRGSARDRVFGRLDITSLNPDEPQNHQNHNHKKKNTEEFDQPSPGIFRGRNNQHQQMPLHSSRLSDDGISSTQDQSQQLAAQNNIVSDGLPLIDQPEQQEQVFFSESPKQKAVAEDDDDELDVKDAIAARQRQKERETAAAADDKEQQLEEAAAKKDGNDVEEEEEEYGVAAAIAARERVKTEQAAQRSLIHAEDQFRLEKRHASPESLSKIPAQPIISAETHDPTKWPPLPFELRVCRWGDDKILAAREAGFRAWIRDATGASSIDEVISGRQSPANYSLPSRPASAALTSRPTSAVTFRPPVSQSRSRVGVATAAAARSMTPAWDDEERQMIMAQDISTRIMTPKQRREQHLTQRLDELKETLPWPHDVVEAIREHEMDAKQRQELEALRAAAAAEEQNQRRAEQLICEKDEELVSRSSPHRDFGYEPEWLIQVRRRDQAQALAERRLLQREKNEAFQRSRLQRDQEEEEAARPLPALQQESTHDKKVIPRRPQTAQPTRSSNGRHAVVVQHQNYHQTDEKFRQMLRPLSALGVRTVKRAGLA